MQEEEWQRATGCPFGPIKNSCFRKRLTDAAWDPAFPVSYETSDSFTTGKSALN